MSDDRDLEEFVGAALSRMPQARAPQTLAPRVMAAVALRQRPGYVRPWFAWPRAWQAMSLVVVAGMATGLGWLSLSLSMPVVASHPAWLVAFLGHVSSLVDWADVVLVPGRALWRVLVAPVAPYLTAAILLMCSAMLVFGITLRRVALGEFAQ